MRACGAWASAFLAPRPRAGGAKAPLTPAAGFEVLPVFQKQTLVSSLTMANTKSAIKAARKTTRLTARNKATKTKIKTLHKKFLVAAKGEDKEAAKAAAKAYASAMDKATKSGVVHKNAASRAKAHTAKFVFAK